MSLPYSIDGWKPLEGPMITYRHSTKDRGPVTVITDKGREYALYLAKCIEPTSQATVSVLTSVKENF